MFNLPQETIGQVCTGLEYLNLEEVTHLCIPSLGSLILARKDTLKTLLLDGEYVTDEFFRHLGKCRKLECLGIAFADSISSQGMEAISELSKLTSLKLMRAKDLPPIEFITTFSSPKMERLTSLNLSECCLLDDNSLTAIATTCRLLRVLINSSNTHILMTRPSCFSRLIINLLSNLHFTGADSQLVLGVDRQRSGRGFAVLPKVGGTQSGRRCPNHRIYSGRRRHRSAGTQTSQSRAVPKY